MTKSSNEIVIFNGPSPDTPIYLRLAVQSATLRLYCRQEYPDRLSLSFDVSALAPEGYDGPFNELFFTDHSIPDQVITATGPGILDRFTITYNYAHRPEPNSESPASVYTGIHEFFETFRMSLTFIAGDKYLMNCEGNLEGSYFRCDCESKFEYLRITDKLPANISDLEETARRYLGQIETTYTSNEHTIYFDAVSSSH
jgi:hypothetical protein